MPTVNFIDYECQVKVSRYADGLTPCLRLVDSEGIPVATATVNVSNLQLAPDCVVIKNYSENEGILEALIAAEILHPTGQTVPVGHCIGHICQLTSKMLAHLSSV
ncbi:hypothetical protein [Floridanema evergladense]|uniref:Uncharacterized protein n=1 Tax=Floridaenema evergladense BLCC-F167 TaxID=3153639 RepID=A0ABV4WND5_9CYAN